MKFTSLYTHSNRPSPTLSPSHNTLVTASSAKSIHIRSTRSLSTLSILSSSSTRNVSYSPDGNTLLVLLSNPICVDVYDISIDNSPKKIRRIHLAPPRPYCTFVFSPDSSGFLTFSEFSLHATYWDLTTASSSSPPVLTKLKSPQCASFNPSKSNIFAAISRERCKDRLNIYVVPSLTYVVVVFPFYPNQK